MLRSRGLELNILVPGLSLILILISGFTAPPPLHPWFTEHFTIGPSALPEGVNASVVPNTTSLYPGEYLVITNTSSTFLYFSTIEPLYTVPTGPQFTAAPVQLHSDGVPAFRMASGKAYVWDVISNEPPWELGWEPVEKYGPSDALRLYIYQNLVAVDDSAYFQYFLAEFETHNKSDYGGERPPNVQIPSPHGITLMIDYGDEEIILPLTISYTLNEHYPARGDYAPEWVSYLVMFLASLCPVIVPGALVVGLLWLFTSERTRVSSDRECLNQQRESLFQVENPKSKIQNLYSPISNLSSRRNACKTMNVGR